jgi:hypothetical protein
MDGRVVLGKHHVRASLQDAQVASHGLGSLAQVRRGDHVETAAAGAAMVTPNGPSGRSLRPQPVPIVSLPVTTR